MHVLFIRRNLFKGKRLNIFSATTDEEKIESAVGNEILFISQEFIYDWERLGFHLKADDMILNSVILEEERHFCSNI